MTQTLRIVVGLPAGEDIGGSGRLPSLYPTAGDRPARTFPSIARARLQLSLRFGDESDPLIVGIAELNGPGGAPLAAGSACRSSVASSDGMARPTR